MSRLEQSISESGAVITRLSVSCQELERVCERLVADVDARKKDVGEISDPLESSRALTAKDRKPLRASFEDDVRSTLR